MRLKLPVALRLLPILLVFCRAASGQSQAAGSARPPNIVVVLVDDLRWDALGCTGSTVAKTPNIDRLAREGVMLRNAFVTTSLCSPSRASFLTGLYAHTHQIWGNEKPNAVRDDQLVTFPQFLQKVGYETALIGKWHMDAHARPRPGFDHWISFKGQGVYFDPVLNVDGTEGTHPGYVTDILNEEAEHWLRAPRTKPFFLWLAHKAVHDPTLPAPRHEKLYADTTLTRPVADPADLKGKPALQVAGQFSGKAPKEAPFKAIGQLRTLAAIDEGVGRLLAALEATGELDRTLFIFTSDNGYFWGEHGLGDKRAPYDESLRIPWIMRWPAEIKAGTKIDGMVLNVDLAPTVLELAGVIAPLPFHGRSLTPLWRQSAPVTWRKSALFEYTLEPRYPRIQTHEAVRTDRWKLIHYAEVQNGDELYDLASDPTEQHNLITDPAQTATLAGLRRELQQLRLTTGLVPPETAP